MRQLPFTNPARHPAHRHQGGVIRLPAPEVSFVVIAHNEAGNIRATISSIIEQDADALYEVIVVDDGSTDGTAAILAEAAAANPDVRVVRLPTNRGRGFARHTGVSAARGSFIATVDADISLPPGWLAECLSALDAADAVGGTAVPDGDIAFLCSWFDLTPKPVAHATKITGSNAVFRREVFERVQFDPALREGEDVALNYALRNLGARLLSLPGLFVRHRESRSVRGAISWMLQSGRGASRQLYRFREVRRPDRVFAGWICTTAIGAIGARARPGRALLAPLAYAGVAACAHVHRGFAWEPGRRRQFIAAIATDTVMLSAYFVGRLAGVFSEAPLPRRQTR